MRYNLLLEGYFKNADAFSVAYDKVNNCVVLTGAGGVQEEMPDGWLDDLMQGVMQIEEITDYFQNFLDRETLEWLSQWMQKERENEIF